MGYLGVDIFFVISGYLISKNLYSSYLRENKIQFLDFYKKRFLRIYPALVSTILFTSVFVILVYPHHLVENYLISAIAAILSVSNILFFRQSGYFDENSVFKPLLHTWSLGVEEQFYIFFPIFLLVLVTITKSRKLLILLIFSALLGSLLLNSFINNESANFYLMPMRIYEFLIGVTIMFIEKNWKLQINNSFVIFLLFLFLTPIVSHYYSFFSIGEGYFPNLVVTLCAGMLIFFRENKLISDMLSFRPLVFLGDISYSLYLVHWPIIVIAKYAFGDLFFSMLISLFFISILMGWIQYNYIENKFRT